MKKTIWLVFLVLLITSCEKILLEEEPADTPISNFEHLWKTVDEKYSFFEYKNINWDEVYVKTRPRIHNDMTQYELFQVLGEMLNILKDGHVNLTAPFDISRYQFTYNAPENFNWRLLKDNYIGWDYRITGSLINTTFQRGGYPIGYIYYGSFSNFVESADIDFVIGALYHTKGIILDMRSNGGGSVNNIYKIGSRFADKKREVYESILKDGPGHEDFTEPAVVEMEPAGAHRYNKTVILLTNRGCFSATSFFATAMKAFPHVIQVGDTTGGGLGSPAGFELPNGWGYRFSVSRTFTPDGENWENGVPPDITVWMDPAEESAGVDAIMEKAIELIVLGD
ncbi:MAG: S41 family peptidase [Bacteroidales bacterium]|nr:S41 family peptidase [Bacteroidales bacterium]